MILLSTDFLVEQLMDIYDVIFDLQSESGFGMCQNIEIFEIM